MTIQQWLTGTPEYLRQAQQGIYTNLSAASSVSTTSGVSNATQLTTDFVVLSVSLGAQGYVKLLGGADTTTGGPCTIGDTMLVANHTGQTVTVYPNQSAGTVKNASSTNLTSNQVGIFQYFGSNNWSAAVG